MIVNELHVVLTPREVIHDLEKTVVGLEIQVKLGEISNVQKDSELLIYAAVNVNNQIYQVAQKVAYNAKQQLQGNLISLGTLWFIELEGEITIQNSEAIVIYTLAE